MKKKLCSILLALTMVLTLLPVSALADEADTQPATSLPAAVDGVITLTKNVELTNELNYTTDVTIVLNGHTITRTNGQKTALMITNGATMTIDGSVAGSAINGTIMVGYSNPTVTNGKLIINGGTYTATVNDDCVVQTNGLCDNCEITATNATFNSTDDTFYLAGNGTYRLENCEINGYTGIYMKSGSLTLNNTTIKATGEYAAPVANGNGASSTGDGIILDAKTGYKGNINLNINGGSISSNNAYAIRETYTDSTATATHSITVNGGTYTSSKDAINVSEYFKKAVASGVSSISISGGTFSDLSALDYLASGANVTVKLAADTTKDVIIPINGNVNLDLNGKTFTTVDCGLSVANGATLTVSDSGTGGKLTSSGTPIRVDGTGSKAIINNGTIESTNDYGIYAKNNGAIIVNGGTVTSKDAALSGNNTTGNMNFEVNGGTLTAAQGPAIYMPGQGKLTVTNGTLNGGISLRMGQVNISGGTINSISAGIDSPAEHYSFSGNAWLPDALYVFGGTYNSKDAQYGNSLNLNITGGTFNCLNDQGSAIAIYDLGKLAQTANVTISGGTFTTNSTTRKAYQVLNLSDIGVTAPKEGYNKPDYVGKVNSSLTGGTYSADPSKYVAPGYVASYNGSTYTVYYPVPVIPNNNNNSSSTTTKNPDGSTTTTTTDKATGAVTETTTTANGSVGTVKTDANGSTEISASISAADVKAAEQKNAPVIAPITVTPAASSAAAPVIKLSVPANAGEVAVAIPVVNAKQGTVAVRVNPDGTEEIIKTAVVTENGLVLGVKGSMQIKVINNSKNFADTVGHWAASDVDFVSARELFNGTAPALFSPEASMTRGMVVTVLARLAGENTDGGANWYDKGCAWAVANGVSDGTDPNGSITREQLAAMLYRYCGSPAASGSLSAYADAASVSAFASDAMQWCVNNGIINGMDGLLNPQGQATRAQVSAMFARYIRLAAAK